MKFRVVDLSVEIETWVTAYTPEGAAEQVLGQPVTRSGGGAGRLLAKVYWQADETTTNMVRLYGLVKNR